MRRNYFFSRNRDALLEPCDGKLSRTVLRGESPRKGADLLDKEKDILTFSVLGKPGGDDVAYNWKNNGHTYIDGVLNNTITSANLLNKKHILTIVNDDVTVENTKTPRYFATDFENYPSKLAFYNSIAFDSIPTEADGFTEQELIDYVLTNIIGQ